MSPKVSIFKLKIKGLTIQTVFPLIFNPKTHYYNLSLLLFYCFFANFSFLFYRLFLFH